VLALPVPWLLNLKYCHGRALLRPGCADGRESAFGTARAMAEKDMPTQAIFIVTTILRRRCFWRTASLFWDAILTRSHGLPRRIATFA